MDAFRADIRSSDGEVPTGMICPDCSGNLVVRAVGDDIRDRSRLVFQCRVGHAYGLEELLIGKEAHIERSMWRAVFAYEELVALLRDVLSHDAAADHAIDDEQFRRRIERAEQIAGGLRALINRDETIRLARSPEN